MENSIIFDGHTLYFDRNPVTYSHTQREKSLNEFKFGTFIVRFPSDGPACSAEKGLIALPWQKAVILSCVRSKVRCVSSVASWLASRVCHSQFGVTLMQSATFSLTHVPRAQKPTYSFQQNGNVLNAELQPLAIRIMTVVLCVLARGGERVGGRSRGVGGGGESRRLSVTG